MIFFFWRIDVKCFSSRIQDLELGFGVQVTCENCMSNLLFFFIIGIEVAVYQTWKFPLSHVERKFYVLAWQVKINSYWLKDEHYASESLLKLVVFEHLPSPSLYCLQHPGPLWISYKDCKRVFSSFPFEFWSLYLPYCSVNDSLLVLIPTCCWVPLSIFAAIHG